MPPRSITPSRARPGRPRATDATTWTEVIALGYPPERIEQVLRFYDEPHRHYHDRRHVQEMLDTAHELGLRLSASQALAVLFHDAVYVPGAPRGFNESLSAQLLRVYAGGVQAPVVDAAYSIILDTIEHVPSDLDSALVQDLDFVRLGVPEDDFDRYSRLLFDEQRPLLAVADEAGAWAFFDRLRRTFYTRLLAREQIYQQAPFRARFEESARRNLRRALGS